MISRWRKVWDSNRIPPASRSNSPSWYVKAIYSSPTQKNRQDLLSLKAFIFFLFFFSGCLLIRWRRLGLFSARKSARIQLVFFFKYRADEAYEGKEKLFLLYQIEFDELLRHCIVVGSFLGSEFLMNCFELRYYPIYLMPCTRDENDKQLPIINGGGELINLYINRFNLYYQEQLDICLKLKAYYNSLLLLWIYLYNHYNLYKSIDQ